MSFQLLGSASPTLLRQAGESLLGRVSRVNAGCAIWQASAALAK